MASKALDLTPLTDCHSFENGRCSKIRECPYRHNLAASRQPNACPNWPYQCRSQTCPFKHPNIVSPVSTPLKAGVRISSPPKNLISFFWDIENVPIPRNQIPFDIVQRIRKFLVVDAGLREDMFSCYCDVRTIPQDKQLSLAMANVRMLHVPDRKSNAADRHILLDLDRFERVHRPPATVVLISGDIDFVGKLSDLRHQAGFRVIVIYSKSVREELKNTADQCYAWEVFTDPVKFALLCEPIQEVRTTRPQIDEPRDRSRGRRSRSRRRGNRSKSRPNTATTIPKFSQPIVVRPPQPIVPVAQLSVIPQDTIICPKCSVRFGTLVALQQHQTAKGHFFHCPMCDDPFQTAASLTQHQNTKNHHFTDYRCGQCNKSFSKLESLNQHQQAMGHEPEGTSTGSADRMQIILDGIAAIKLAYLQQSKTN